MVQKVKGASSIKSLGTTKLKGKLSIIMIFGERNCYNAGLIP